MTLRHTPFYAALLLALGAPAASAQDDASKRAAEPLRASTAAELIDRDALFGNPERANVQISPDGKYLSWVAPVGGVLNVWIAPASDLSQAKAVTDDKARGIRQYFWSIVRTCCCTAATAAATRISTCTASISARAPSATSRPSRKRPRRSTLSVTCIPMRYWSA